MKADIWIVGGILNIHREVNGTYSTVLYLEKDERKILIDPGSYVSHIMLEEKLLENGIKPEDITDVILTHFHLDHAFNTVFFKNATVHLHAAYKRKNYEKFGIVVGKLYKMVLESWKKINELNGGEILFDSIKILHSPWHAKEHVSLVVETNNMGRLFLPGDICMTRLDYYEIYKGYRSDEVSKFVLENSKNCDLIVFTHDKPIKPFS